MRQWARSNIWNHYFVISYFLLIIRYIAFKANVYGQVNYEFYLKMLKRIRKYSYCERPISLR